MAQLNVKKAIRERYGAIAKSGSMSCCGPLRSSAKSCCGSSGADAKSASVSVGYAESELNSVPESADMGLGCGNPLAFASIREGDTVLDLGSGGGIDCFLAAQRVGASGRVIGVDMTAEMIERARGNAEQSGYSNVEFRLGEIEHLPVADSSVDLVISNCVINLSPDKGEVFKEIHRVLKPGGKIMVSDIVLTGELPESIMKSLDAYVGCIAGAAKKGDYLEMINSAGLKDVRVMEETKIPADLWLNDPLIEQAMRRAGIGISEGKKYSNSIVSIKVSGRKE